MNLMRALVAGGLAVGLAGCGKPVAPQEGGQEPSQGGSGGNTPALVILSGSENKELEPLLKTFADERGVRIEMRYRGSVEISRELERGVDAEGDAVWPAASLWIELGDTKRVVRHTQSIFRSPVVFAIKSSLADRLGWKKKDVTVADVLEAVETRNVRFAMTSATQSNSGAAWYLGCLYAFSGAPDMLTSEHLHSPELRGKIRRLLGQVDRSSGSSGWLKTFLVEHYAEFDAMVNYEAMVIEANRELEAAGREPLYMVYPVDGLSIADSALGLVDKGDADKERLFLELQKHLLSAPVQDSIRRLGRRTGMVGIAGGTGAADVFKPAWGCDLDRILTPVRTPAAPVLREALNLYQTAFRKPSLTAFVLDVSGSMKGAGETQLKRAMSLLLDPEESARLLLQASGEDVSVVVPFNQAPLEAWEFSGNDPETLRQNLRRVQALQPDGGTDMYSGALEAFRRISARAAAGGFTPAVIVMSDGESKGSLDALKAALDREGAGADIPVFTILFGAASEEQMKLLAESFSGKMFDGRKDVTRAFREAKGYN